MQYHPPVQAVIFDFDGTLAHLTIDFSEMRHCAEEAVRRTIAPFSAIADRYLQPDPDIPVLEWVAKGYNGLCSHPAASDNEHAQLVELARRMQQAADEAIIAVEVKAAEQGGLFSWSRTLLSTLAAQGITPCIITRNCTQAVQTIFPDVHRYCTTLLTRDDVPKVKPDPDHLLRALEIAGCPPERALMVGDHPMDIETGKAGGTLTAGVYSGYQNKETLASQQPDFIAKDARELYNTLCQTMWAEAPRI